MTTGNTFTIAVFGFSHVERKHVSCVCKLSQVLSRRPVLQHSARFQLVELMQAQYADILLVDADDAEALQAWSFFKAKWPSIPTILVNNESVDTGDLIEISLARRSMAGVLFRLLRNIAKHLQAKDAYRKARPAGDYSTYGGLNKIPSGANRDYHPVSPPVIH